MNPCLYIVATPIGNRDDMTTRAVQILGDVDFIVAEDTRHSGELLAFFGVKKPLLSFRDAPRPIMERTLKEIVKRIQEGEAAAYITDAGTPNISDPGWRLVESLLKANIPVIPIPGPSAVACLLSVTNVGLDEYRFIGFLPKKKGHQNKITELVDYLNHKDHRGVVFYESPNRVRKTLLDFLNINKQLHALVGRELTKKFETLYYGQLTEDFIKQLPEKGEYAILIHNVNQNK